MSGFIVTGEQLAGIYQVTLRTVQNWRRSKGLPAVAKDRYDLVQVVKWSEARIRAELDTGDSSITRLLKAQADERSEKAIMARLKRRQREGELLEADAVHRMLIERIVAVTAAMKALAIRLAQELSGVNEQEKIERIVQTAVFDCRGRFAEDSEISEAAGAFSAEVMAAMKGKKTNAARKRAIEKVFTGG